MKGKTEGVQKLWNRYKYVVLVILIGAVLLLLPDGGKAEQALPQTEALGAEKQDLQKEMEEILGNISGVGQVQVLLTVDSDGERQLAQNNELRYSGPVASPEDYSRRSEVVLTNEGSGEEAVVIRRVYPRYRGALVVCQGGDRADVKLAVTKAVAALTGLASDRITVAKWQ